MDGVFAVISEGIQDIATSVRTAAASRLGTLPGVTSSLILQVAYFIFFLLNFLLSSLLSISVGIQ